jgi:hypothetical protein
MLLSTRRINDMGITNIEEELTLHFLTPLVYFGGCEMSGLSGMNSHRMRVRALKSEKLRVCWPTGHLGLSGLRIMSL